ncbi:MAG: Gfo/Idh/MocA family oxidoreductase [Candidatus Neomarinimicrobiota bacterium]|jgi:predicted dehydrogenase|nr:Gfo/Idh/MocA family oxidoreductase [Candidatus Neomarinimicrobiota bacterium]MDD3965472.1 Gfo/Idh/MocA family oxidoreductase [Candidatus Neomarinimicrobiota bacterium]MDX9780844.1 Gfo/Idh/MocA family oxidoreductase [bacterium]
MKVLNEVVWGIIGAGNVCERKSMPAMQIIPHSRVKCVMRRNADACRDFALRHDIPEWTNEAAKIFRDPQINAVYIATPPDTHAYYTGLAAAAGKAVYVEKPMARNYAECREMLRVCTKADVPLFVAYYRRMLPHFRRVKELIDGGTIGTICSVHIEFYRPPYAEDSRPEKNWRIQPAISGGGHFHDLASHQLDLMDFFMGPLKRVRGIAVNRAGLYTPADTVSASFSFSGGAAGSGSWCFVAPEERTADEISIIGTGGSLNFSTFAHARIEGISESRGVLREEYVLPSHIQEFLIRTVIAELRGEGRCPSKGKSAARTTLAMDLICS